MDLALHTGKLVDLIRTALPKSAGITEFKIRAILFLAHWNAEVEGCSLSNHAWYVGYLGPECDEFQDAFAQLDGRKLKQDVYPLQDWEIDFVLKAVKEVGHMSTRDLSSYLETLPPMRRTPVGATVNLFQTAVDYRLMIKTTRSMDREKLISGEYSGSGEYYSISGEYTPAGTIT